MSGIRFKYGVGVFAQAVLYDDGYLTDVYTHPWARRHGYATRVIREVCRHADARGIRMNIHIHKYGKGGASRTRLAEFYGRFGFVLCGSCGRTMERAPVKQSRTAAPDREVVQHIVYD